MTRPAPNVAFLGAGSTVFARALVADILSYPELAGAEIRLFDIDERRLRLSEAVARRVAQELGVRSNLVVTTDRDRALDGADYALSMIQVGGYRPATVLDFEIPKRHGLRQTIGDTLGIGGIMRALRTIPVLLSFQDDMQRLCPDVLHLNYANPMAMNCRALTRAGNVATVGLCHSVQHTAWQLARDVGVPLDEVDYLVAGINHLAFFLRFERHGQDLTPAIQRVIDEGRVPDENRARYDLFRRFGYFVTESSEHLVEYVPWYLKHDRPDLIERYAIPLDEYPGRCELYALAWEAIEQELRAPGSQDGNALRERLAASGVQVMRSQVAAVAEQVADLRRVRRSDEYAAGIIHAIHTGQPRVVYGNVPNDGLIDDLPDGCCVEVPCVVDGNGVQPTRVGAMPPQLTAVIRTNVNVQELTVEAVLSGKKEHVYHAAMLDPRTGAELDPDQIVALVDELLAAQAEWLPESLRA